MRATRYFNVTFQPDAATHLRKAEVPEAIELAQGFAPQASEREQSHVAVDRSGTASLWAQRGFLLGVRALSRGDARPNAFDLSIYRWDRQSRPILVNPMGDQALLAAANFVAAFDNKHPCPVDL
jgi:hypothetical protein